MFRGQVASATPTRLIEEDNGHLVLAHWAGVHYKAPATYREARKSGDPALRKRCIDELVSGDVTLVDLIWGDTTMLTGLLPGEWFAVCFLFAAPRPRFLGWYFNFEEPFTRTGSYVDSNDLVLDLWVDADGGRQWKDEEEYRHACRVGFVSPAQAREVDVARERAVGMLDERTGPLAAGWHEWRPDPTWPDPVLPPDWSRTGGGARP